MIWLVIIMVTCQVKLGHQFSLGSVQDPKNDLLTLHVNLHDLKKGFLWLAITRCDMNLMLRLQIFLQCFYETYNLHHNC